MKLLLTLFVAMLAMTCDAGPSPDKVKAAASRAREIVAERRENKDKSKDSRCSLSELQTEEIASEVTLQLNLTSSVSVTCDPSYPYRTIDGSCNNLDNPEWGKAHVEQRRVLPSAYADGLGSPRAYSVTGANVLLPNPRTVSNKVHKADKKSKKSKANTLLLMAFGQFLDHDIIFTPLSDATDCCSEDPDEECFPLIVEKADDTFPAGYCMDVSRSAAFSSSNELGVQQQENSVTSFVDASNVYGSSEKEIALLRKAGTGLLRTGSNDRLPDNPHGECRLSNESLGLGYRCSLAGDVRVNEVPTLTSCHTAWMREHNRIAKELENIFTDPETLFQQSRRILIAEMQQIVYNEFLPAILSPETMATYGLGMGEYEYDITADATIRNSFGHAYRFGHSMVQNQMNLFKQNLNVFKRGKIEEEFFVPDMTYEPKGLEKLAYWLLGDEIQKMNREIMDSLRNLLFVDDKGNSLDLAALNIHRGRDHGIPSYYNFRKWCGLTDADDFTTGPGGLIDHDADTVKRLDNAYDATRDIDLWTGAVSETPVSGGLVGPTLQCILGRQFRALKRGDRFWFEGEAANFTPEQLTEIKKASLSKLLCDNMNFKKIQKDAFDARSKMMKCSEIKGMDLAKFSPS